MTTTRKGSGRLHKRTDGRYAVEYRFSVPLDTDDPERAESMRADLWHQLEAIKCTLKPPDAAPALIPVASAWIAFKDGLKRSNTSENTIRSYGSAWAAFAEWCQRAGITNCNEIGEADADAWLDSLDKSASYHNLAVTACRQVLRAALRTGSGNRTVKTPFDGCATLSTKAARGHRPFTDEELARILGAADGELLTCCMVLAYTGQRVGDSLTWPSKQIDLDRRRMWRIQAKTGRRVELGMHRALWDRLVSCGMGREYAIPGLASDYMARNGNVYRSFSRLFRTLHISSTTDGMVGSHSFRYTFVTKMRESGVPDSVVAGIVGHGSKAIMDHYTRIGVEATERAISALPEWTKGAAE